MVKLYGKSLTRNKKGSLQDIVFFIGVCVAFAVLILIAFKVVTELNDRFQIDDNIPSEGKTASSTLTNYYPGVIDNSFLFFTIGLTMVILILAALVRIHPIFIPFFFIGWVILIFVSGVASNIYTEIASEPEFITLGNDLTFITNLLTILPLLVGVLGMVLMVIMYKQWQVSQF